MAGTITYLYIIRSGLSNSDPIKIGIADNVENRLSGMQTGNPRELVVLYKIPMNSRNHAFMVENRLHRKLSKFNIRGEWFVGRALNKIHIKDLLEKRKHEKLYHEDDLDMIYEANKYI